MIRCDRSWFFTYEESDSLEIHADSMGVRSCGGQVGCVPSRLSIPESAMNKACLAALLLLPGLQVEAQTNSPEQFLALLPKCPVEVV